MKSAFALVLFYAVLSATPAYAGETPEQALEFVRALYNGLLLRGNGGDGDPGQQDWVNALVNGASRSDVENAFRNSDEYKAKHQDEAPPAGPATAENPDTPTDPTPDPSRENTEFVRSLYRDLLKRPDGGDSDPGRQAWVDALNGGASRDSVRRGIMGSEEFKDKNPAFGTRNAGVFNSRGEVVAYIRDSYRRIVGKDIDPAILGVYVEDFLTGRMNKAEFESYFGEIAIANNQESENPTVLIAEDDPNNPPADPGPTREQILAQNLDCIRSIYRDELGRSDGGDSDPGRQGWLDDLNNFKKSCAQVRSGVAGSFEARQYRARIEQERLNDNARFVMAEATRILERPIGQSEFDNDPRIRELFRRLNDGTYTRAQVTSLLYVQRNDEVRLAGNADFIRTQALTILGHPLSQAQFDHLFRRLNDYTFTRNDVINQINGIKIAETYVPEEPTDPFNPFG